jgi:hypothetical protein
MVKKDIPNNEEFAEQVKDFATNYLFGPLNEAKEKGIAPNIAVFALMECLQLIISSNVKDRSMAIAEFEALATAFVQDWKERK